MLNLTAFGFSAMGYRFDQNYFNKLAEDNHQGYILAKPFPHIILENVFPALMLDQILNEFPSSNQIDWVKFNNPNERKLASRDELQFGETTRQFIHVLNSKPFLFFLEKLTGVSNLIPDPALEGGGLHQTTRGGLLKIHADFNKHSKTNLDRRLNVLIYLNKDWKHEYGGDFELWDENMTKAEIKIQPLYNRMVIFSTTSKSYHGHPDPLACPDNASRKSIAMYYYTNGRPAAEIVEGLEKHDTLFRSRSGNDEVVKVTQKTTARAFLKKFIPPILVDLKNKLMK
jgi:Rps23 Pro-64 3,4-dihydroxylase Tpa1-like proline 4-hydroxylase